MPRKTVSDPYSGDWKSSVAVGITVYVSCTVEMYYVSNMTCAHDAQPNVSISSLRHSRSQLCP